MYTKTLLAVALAFAMMGMQSCFYSGPSRHWNGQGYQDQGYQDNEPQYGHYESRNTLCDSNGGHCVVCDADNDNCRRTVSNSWFIW
jgi:hypothetical protein